MLASAYIFKITILVYCMFLDETKKESNGRSVGLHSIFKKKIERPNRIERLSSQLKTIIIFSYIHF